VVDTWQRGLVTRCVLLALNGARFRVDAIAVSFMVLDRHVVAIVLVALGQLLSEHGLARQLLFGFLEASSAGRFWFHGAAAGLGDLGASGRVHAPGVSGGRVVLLGPVVTLFGAGRGVESGGAFAATFFNDLGVAWTLFFQGVVHTKTSPLGEDGAVDVESRLSGSLAGAVDFFASVSVHAPALAGGSPVLGGFEKTIFIASGNVVSYDSSWA